MANKGGVITQKEVIEDGVINWGVEYKKNVELAIATNKEFSKSILEMANANKSIKTSNSQKEYVENQSKVNEISKKTIEIWKEQDQLEKALISTKKKQELATEGTNRALVAERLELARINAAVKKETLDRLGLTTAYTKLNQARTEAKVKLKDLIITEGESSKATQKAREEFEKLDAKVKQADHAVGDFTKNVGNYPKLDALTGGLKNLVGAFGLVGGITLFATVVKGAFNIIKEFGQAVADLSAITGATGKDLEYLKTQAIELGKETKGGATAVVEAYKLIASAKPELLSNVDALNQFTESTLLLAKAAGMEIPDAATALTDAMNQLGADSSQATKFVDTLAAGAKYGAAEIPQITDALLKFGAVARTSNISIQESTALVELLAENGLKGADAGVALRNVLLKLSAPDALPRKAKEAIHDLGISFKDLSDTSKPIQERLELLKPLLKDNTGMVKTFGVENVVAATNILQHTDRLKDLTKKVDENGVALSQANTRTNTLSGSMDRLESSWSSFILSLSEKGNGLGGILKGITDEITSTVDGWNRLFTSKEKLREFELAKIRKEGVESIAKSYSDTNKLNAGQLEMVKRMNSLEISENAKKVNSLIAENARLSQNTVPLTGAVQNDSFNKILENRNKIKDLNSKSTSLIGKNQGIDSLIKKTTTQEKTPIIQDTSQSTGIDPKEEKDKKKAAQDELGHKKRLNDALFELEKQRLERSIYINNEVAKNNDQTDEVRILALKESKIKQDALVDLTKQHSLDADLFVTKEHKLNANQKTLIDNEATYKKIDIEKKTIEEIAKLNEFDTKKYEDDIKRKISLIEIENNNKLLAEDERYKKELEKGFANDLAKEKAAKDHERNLFNIKKEGLANIARYQILALNEELNAYEEKAKEDGIITEKESDFILSLRKKVSDLSIELIKEEGSTFNENEDKKSEKSTTTTELEIQKIQKIQEISSSALSAVGDLSNAFFERKIQGIDEEIARNDEYYAKQIELAGNDQRKKDALTTEAEKKRKKLEDEKRKEQHKQAVFNKAMQATQITISTIGAVMTTLRDVPKVDYGISAGLIAAAYGVMGAAQLAAVLATPIPKYKEGRRGGKEELAYVGDGGRHEVIQRASGIIELTPKTDTLVKLQKDDIVHKSVDDFIFSQINSQGQKVAYYQSTIQDNTYNQELLKELKENTKAVKNNKANVVVNLPKQDFGHEIWKMRNTNWS